jgi:hypothetical protein
MKAPIKFVKTAAEEGLTGMEMKIGEPHLSILLGACKRREADIMKNNTKLVNNGLVGISLHSGSLQS